MPITLFIMCIAVLVAYAASLPGTLLLLRGVSLLSDAISHAVLLGIAVMFLIVQSLTSVWLFIGATVAGLATVVLTEAVVQSQRLRYDAAIGIIFPVFFSVGILLISLYARNVHLDIDMVVLGEIAFAPFYRFTLFGYDLGPFALWSGGIMSIINTAFVVLLFKELKVTLFDPNFAHVIRLRPRLLYYLLMTITSITAVGSFEIVGSIVVVALMITPAATAYLLVDTFGSLLIGSSCISMLSAVIGYGAARIADVSIAGAIASVTGVIFICVLLCAPRKGLVARFWNTYMARKQLSHKLIYAYLRDCPQCTATKQAIATALQWNTRFVESVIADGVHSDALSVSNGRVTLRR